MSSARAAPLDTELVSSDELRAVLSRGLDPSRRIVELERALCPSGSSWWLEEITLHLDDNSQIALVFKNLVREAEGSAARRVKPAFVTDPSREPWVYQNLLLEVPGTAKLWAALTDLKRGRHWLFLERMKGQPLAQLGDREAWCSAARWLGNFHATVPVPHTNPGPLLKHDPDYHRRWLARAISAAQYDAHKLARLRALARIHERAIAEALATGWLLIHGEFYPSNVLISESGAVHAIDWEMAALGPPLLDLAALMSGHWSAHERAAMMRAYRDGASAMGARLPLPDEFVRRVAACQLILAVQWLGWSAGWTAPADHDNDWLQEAERCAGELCR